MARRILAASRYLIIIAIIGTCLTSIFVLLYGGLITISIVLTTLTHATFTIEGVKYIELESIEIIDLFLLGTVLYIIALGLYSLFIDNRLPLPSWLIITDLDDLKVKLIGIVVVLLAVTFLGYVIDWNENGIILNLGIAIAAVVLALSFLLGNFLVNHKKPSQPNNDTYH
jgi:uncharacterized membrane protein YqhA